MADLVDIADRVIAEDLAHQLANMPKFDAPSCSECEDCGEVIPVQRQALGNVKLCITCQTILEQDTRKYKGKI